MLNGLKQAFKNKMILQKQMQMQLQSPGVTQELDEAILEAEGLDPEDI